MWKLFAVLSHRIWQTGPQNLEEFAADNCDPYLQQTADPQNMHDPPTFPL